MANQKILIDTSVLIDHFRRKDKTKTLLSKLLIECDLFISSITDYEFRAGSNEANKLIVNNYLNEFKLLDFNLDCSKKACNIREKLKRINKIIDLPDLFIAATALVNDLPLATLNKKHFERIENLKLI